MKRKMLGMFLATVLMFGTFDVTYGATIENTVTTQSTSTTIVKSGECGENVIYTLDSNGLLKISGSGNMNDYYIGNSPFYLNKDIKEIVIGDGVTSIGDCAFWGCSSLTSIEISDGVTSIGMSVFDSCSSLTSIEIPNSVKVIEKQAFYKCKKLEKVKLGNNVETIGNSAFQTTNIKNVKIPNSVKAMGVAAFDSDKTKINVEIPGNITVDKAHWISVCNAGKITFTTDLNIELIQHLEAEDFEVSKNDPNYTSIDGNIYTKDGKTLVRVAALKKNVRIVDGCENICTSAFLYTPLGLNWEAKLRKHIDNLFIPKTVKNIDEKSYITYESEPEKITSEERAKVQKGAVTINNIQIENKNFDVNILSKLLDKVTCNKDEVLKQLTAK